VIAAAAEVGELVLAVFVAARAGACDRRGGEVEPQRVAVLAAAAEVEHQVSELAPVLAAELASLFEVGGLASATGSSTRRALAALARGRRAGTGARRG